MGDSVVQIPGEHLSFQQLGAVDLPHPRPCPVAEGNSEGDHDDRQPDLSDDVGERRTAQAGNHEVGENDAGPQQQVTAFAPSEQCVRQHDDVHARVEDRVVHQQGRYCHGAMRDR